ncbi:MAG: hypothetical protein ACK4EY_15075 [Flavipsychrobacter sp.]
MEYAQQQIIPVQDDSLIWKSITPIKVIILNKKESVKIGLKPLGGKLGECHLFLYRFISEDNEIQYEGNMLIAGEDYQKWGDDDSYPFECLQREVPVIEFTPDPTPAK